MRILLVHCRYRQRGGEDSVFETEVSQLSEAGQDVSLCEFSNDDIAAGSAIEKLRTGIQTVWATESVKQLRERVRSERPDVVHFHNTFPVLSPRAYRVCREEGVPVVQTLHNFRTFCAGAMLMRDGKVCEACFGGHFYQGVRYACYRQSRLASAAVVAMQYVHHGMGTFTECVDAYIALTDFAKVKCVAGGLPESHIVVKPNSLTTDPGMGAGAGDYVLFVGRLSEEKGIRTLLEAWKVLTDIPLVMAGDGPLLDYVKARAQELGHRVTVLGRVSEAEVANLMGSARLLVMPSEWYEGFPMTAVEAYARGLPIIASRIGSLAEIVHDGVSGALFPAGDCAALAATVNELISDQERLGTFRRGARQQFVDHYSAANNVAALLSIYSAVVERRAVA